MDWLRREGAPFSERVWNAIDFRLVVGGDLTLGYRFHDDRAAHLFCVETVGAHVLTTNAVCGLGAASVGRVAEPVQDRSVDRAAG